MIWNLLWIHLIVVLIFLSGFIDSVDEAISKRFRFHHLPKPFSCCLCSTFWTSVIYLLFTKEFTLLTLLYALVSATLTEVTTPLITLIKNLFLKIIEIMNKILW
jgi:hypothetical protein